MADSLDNITVATFYLVGMKSAIECGSCSPEYCPCNEAEFEKVTFFPFPSQLSEIEEDLKTFFEDVKEVFHETGMQMCPSMLCLPFLICVCYALCHYEEERKSRLYQLILNFNHRIANPKGILIRWNRDYHAFNDINFL